MLSYHADVIAMRNPNVVRYLYLSELSEPSDLLGLSVLIGYSDLV